MFLRAVTDEKLCTDLFHRIYLACHSKKWSTIILRMSELYLLLVWCLDTSTVTVLHCHVRRVLFLTCDKSQCLVWQRPEEEDACITYVWLRAAAFFLHSCSKTHPLDMQSMPHCTAQCNSTAIFTSFDQRSNQRENWNYFCCIHTFWIIVSV